MFTPSTSPPSSRLNSMHTASSAAKQRSPVTAQVSLPVDARRKPSPSPKPSVFEPESAPLRASSVSASPQPTTGKRSIRQARQAAGAVMRNSVSPTPETRQFAGYIPVPVRSNSPRQSPDVTSSSSPSNLSSRRATQSCR